MRHRWLGWFLTAVMVAAACGSSDRDGLGDDAGPTGAATATSIPPTEQLGAPTEPLVIGDCTIAVFNGTPSLNGLLAWALGRFEAADLNQPPVASATFTLDSELCDDLRAFYRPTPAGAELTFCFVEGTACLGWSDPCQFSIWSRSLVLHELAHSWMDGTLEEPAQQRFMDHVGLEAWNDHAIDWDRRAVEHAADTIAWGLMDRETIMLRIGRPSADHLTTGFRMLTGVTPLHQTDDVSSSCPTSVVE